MISTAGSSFDRSDKNVYFIASNIDRMRFASAHKYILVAVNEVANTNGGMKQIEQWIDEGKKILLDSGIFWLAMEHARRHNVSHDVALNLAPDKIDKFDWLLEHYLRIVKTFGDNLWGYIELDQGGKENKLKTRAMLHDHGLNPIPVYHPFGDGWDYFDYLATNYDRICFGNIVQARQDVRRKLVATAWERHRRYPNLWIHLLGMTPNEWLYALPVNSGDSSSWLGAVRWGKQREAASGRMFGDLPSNFIYQYGAEKYASNGPGAAVTLASYVAYCSQLNWRNHIAAMNRYGFETYPEVTVG